MGAIESQGTTFSIDTSDTSTPTWVAIGGFKDFNGFGGSAAVIDATTLSSTAKEKLMGLQDFGQFSINFNHDDADAGQVALVAARATRAKTKFKLTLSDTTTYTFSGFVTTKSLSGAVDSLNGGSATIEISGGVVVTAPVAP